MTVLFIFLAVLVLVSVLGVAHSRRTTVGPSSDPLADIVPVDLRALANLLDANEDEFLRSRLSKSDYRAIRRARLRAAGDYVSGLGRNAAVLVQIGELAAHQSNPTLARAGRELSETAIRVRMRFPLIQMYLYAHMLVPNLNLSSRGVLDPYEQLCSSAREVFRLQDPKVRATSLLFGA